ncbi:MAG: S8 family serine peptidase [Methanosarcina sp.]|uniref:S8 family serine peptidase n=1 Tax=Methanosarcina sp. TaxID=2213 RepID=UPI002602807C|nr:S8 family serine peptidase [Methanosarcina sp.]MDD3247618.1 S8 family serine peptidase [Methanosarcina sp.]MDD4247731.1 S8 family serine peptidase [Methanosarcina sp.]
MVTTAGAVPVIIGFKDKAHPEMVQPYGKVTHSYKYIPAVAADLPEQAIENLKKNKNIAYIEPDFEVKALGETLPWGIERIGAPQVHASDNKGTGVNVAIIDTGIDHTHLDLNENYKGGYDFVNNDADPMDDNGHGTHCAGIIAAVDDDTGVIGVAPEANLYALKILDSTGSGDSSDLIAAIDWAIATHGDDGDDLNDIQIISMSLGSDSGLESLNSVCTEAYYTHGILLVAAAGNDGNRRGTGDSVDYPGAYSSVIAVAATDSNDVRASFSSTGPAVELAAPGVNIFSTYLGGYASASGTSMACPHVAGTAALVLYANPTFTNENVRGKLAQTTTDLGTSGRDTLYGFGLVNAEAAAIVSEPDETDPEISNVDAEAAAYSATITWTTDEASNSTVRYSTDTSYFEEESNPTQVTSHTVELTGLDPATIYYYEVLSSDAAGNTAVDNNDAQYYSFTTSEENVENLIHIDSVKVTTSKRVAGKNIFVSAKAVVTILSSNGPVEGAIVSGKWSGATSDIDSATTNNEGTVTVYSDEVKYKSGTLTFTFTVNDVNYTIPWNEKELSDTGTYTSS